jgi:hypothetical protein
MLVMGDALCSFNPAYGQGVTVAAKEAQLLDAWLRDDMRGGPHAFFRAAARIVDVPWSTVVHGDLQWPGVRGTRSYGASLMNGLFKRLVRASTRDHGAARALLSVMHLVSPPSTLFSPALLLSALRHGGEPEARTAGEKPRSDKPTADPFQHAPFGELP